MAFQYKNPNRDILKALFHALPPGQWFTAREAKQVLIPALLTSRINPLAPHTLRHTWRNIYEWAMAHDMMTRSVSGKLYCWGKPKGPALAHDVKTNTSPPNAKVYSAFRLAMPLDLEFTSTQAINTIESQNGLTRLQATGHWRRIRKYCEVTAELRYLNHWRRGGVYKWNNINAYVFPSPQPEQRSLTSATRS